MSVICSELAETKAAFKANDVDGKGWISSEDMSFILKELGLSEPQVQELLKDASVKEDKVDYGAFMSGLCTGITESAHLQWIEDRWLPFVTMLRDELRQVEYKAEQGFAETERVPPQSQIMKWGHQAIKLTEEARGPGNGTPNVVFQLLMRMAQYDGVAPYRFEQVPIEWSKDGFIRVVDGVTRGSFYAHAPKPAGGGNDGAIDESGNLKQSVKDSAIGNTQISNVMTKRDADMLVLGTLIRGLTLRVVKKRQSAALDALINLTEGREKELLMKLKNSREAIPSPTDVNEAKEYFGKELSKAEEGAVPRDPKLAEAYAAAGVLFDNTAGKSFIVRGVPVQNFGQLPSQTKVQIQRLVEKMVDEDMKGAATEVDKELEEFVTFLRDHPGSLWKDSKEEHRQMIIKAQFSNQVQFVNRDKIEKQTQHRFMPIRWTRTVPLLEGRPDGEPPLERRPAGQKESSRVRKNAFAYDDEHGLGLCSPTNCLDDALDVRQGVAHECPVVRKQSKGAVKSSLDNMGESMVVDEGAKLGNWFMTDIEKIITEFAIMNVRGWNEKEDEFLPGEAPIMVGQNPRAASSIGATQHTQMSTASAGKWPVLRLRAPGGAASRKWWTLDQGVEAQVELVQVGNKEDTVLLRVQPYRRAHAAHPVIIKLLHEARKALLLHYGGRDIDFNVFAAANVHTPGAVITFCPVNNVGPDPDNKYIWVNPDTKDRSDELGLPVQTNDFSQGKGNWMVWGDEAWKQSVSGGRDIMATLYDFTRKPGMRSFMVDYLQKSITGWTDVAGRAELDADAVAPHCTADEFWEATKQK